LEERTFGRVASGEPPQRRCRYRDAVDVVGRWCGWIAAAFALQGCFSESPSGGGDDCEPGSELCACHDGECFGDLQCRDDLCRAPITGGDGSDTASSVGETIADASSQSSSEVGESTIATTMPSDTGGTTDATVDSGMPTSDVGDSGVDGSACHACAVATLDAGSDCEMVFFGCAPNGECMSLADCVLAAVDADDPAGIPMCCDAHGSGTMAYGDLANCWGSTCARDCADFMLTCGG
jgi:hypothetical protein